MLWSIMTSTSPTLNEEYWKEVKFWLGGKIFGYIVLPLDSPCSCCHVGWNTMCADRTPRADFYFISNISIPFFEGRDLHKVIYTEIRLKSKREKKSQSIYNSAKEITTNIKKTKKHLLANLCLSPFPYWSPSNSLQSRDSQGIFQSSRKCSLGIVVEELYTSRKVFQEQKYHLGFRPLETSNDRI